MPTVLRCTAKLLARLRRPAVDVAEDASDNPLGEWYADVDTWRREPFVVMLNAATGATLVLPARAADLRELSPRAALQFGYLCEGFGLRGPAVEAEVRGLEAGFTLARTRDRSLLGSLNERKFATQMQFEHNSLPHAFVAARDWDGLFKRRALGKGRLGDYHVPLDLLRARLLPSATVIDLAGRRAAASGI